MSDRYSWIKNQDYDGSYDRLGHKDGKRYRCRDNKTGETFPFPEEKIIKVEGHATLTYEYFSSGHNSEEFIEFCCKTAPSSMNEIPYELVTPKIAQLMIENESSAYIIKYIPKKFLTEELIETIVQKFPDSIFHMPKELFTPRLYEKAIKVNGNQIEHMPEECRTTSICLLAISTCSPGFEIGKYIPKQSFTLLLAQRLIDKEPSSIVYIPEEYITKEISEKVIEKHPFLIEHIPARYITHEFLQKLETLGIEFPNSVMPYLKEGLSANIDNQDDLKSHVIIIEDKDYSEFRNITLSSLQLNSFISDKVLRFLTNINISTLEELFKSSNNPNFIKELTKNRTTLRLYHEILGTIRLLKTKYLGEDPQVRYKVFDDNSLVELGLTFRTFHQLYTSDHTGEEIYEMVKNEDYDRLLRIQGIGPSALEEVKAKLGIVTQYYEEKALNEQEEDLRDLFEELQELIKESQRISMQIEIVNEKIRRKTLEKTEGEIPKK